MHCQHVLIARRLMVDDPSSISADLCSALHAAASTHCVHSLCITWMRFSQSSTTAARFLASAAAAQVHNRLLMAYAWCYSFHHAGTCML